MNMMPVLLPPSLSSIMLASPSDINSAIIRGRKRTNESLDGHLFAKRNSNSDLSDDDSASTPRKGSPGVDDERRAHHNELERRRRDHIKDHFMCLKDAIPLLEGEKSSRALILKRAVEYISLINQRVAEQAAIIDELQRKNDNLQHKDSSSASVSPVIAVSTMLPTTSAASSVSPITIEPIIVPVSSSFSPVIPSKPAPAAPATTTMADLAMLIALQQQQQAAAAAAVKPAFDPASFLTKDLATLLSLNSLKENSQFVAPLLF